MCIMVRNIICNDKNSIYHLLYIVLTIQSLSLSSRCYKLFLSNITMRLNFLVN